MENEKDDKDGKERKIEKATNMLDMERILFKFFI